MNFFYKIWGIFILVFLFFKLALAGEEGSHGITLSQIKNLLWFSINFLVFLFILYKLLKKPVVNFFKNRKENFLKEYEELLTKKKAAEAKYLELQEKIKNLKVEAEAIYQNYIEQGIREKERILEEAKQQAERLKEYAQLYIVQEIEKAKDTLRKELAEEALSLAEEILRKNISQEDQKNLFNNFLEQIKGRSLN